MVFHWLGQHWQVAVSHLVELRPGLESMAADWGGATILLRTDRPTIATVGTHMLGVDIEPFLDGDLRALMIESAFAQLVDLVEVRTRKRLTLLDGPFPDDGQRSWFEFRMDDGRQTVMVDVGFDAYGLGFFAEALRRLPVDPGGIHKWGELPIPVRFMVGVTDLSIKVFNELKRRDVIILDESWVGPGTDAIAINFGRRYAAAGVLAGCTITLTGPLEEIMGEDEEEYLDEAESLGKLSVRLSFDLGKRSISLAELMQLGPGYVFDLGRDIRKAVTIRANGSPIGEGEIVDVDGRIGVVVLRLEPTA